LPVVSLGRVRIPSGAKARTLPDYAQLCPAIEPAAQRRVAGCILLALTVALTEVELGQFQVAGLGNLQINRRTVDHGNRVAGALDD